MTRDIYTASVYRSTLQYWFLPWSGDEPPGEQALTMVAKPNQGSSDPTAYGNSHRLAETAGGRLLTVYGLHQTGVQLEWKDPNMAWSPATTGDVINGTLLSGTRTGDWPASITVARGPDGQETAIVVWSGVTFGTVRPLQMRVLTNLDAAQGPRSDPSIAVDGSGFRLVAVRSVDGFVVSRHGEATGVWETSDRVEIGAEGGGEHNWPSALDSKAGGLRFVVSGPSDGVSSRSSVLAYSGS